MKLLTWEERSGKQAALGMMLAFAIVLILFLVAKTGDVLFEKPTRYSMDLPTYLGVSGFFTLGLLVSLLRLRWTRSWFDVDADRQVVRLVEKGRLVKTVAFDDLGTITARKAIGTSGTGTGDSKVRTRYVVKCEVFEGYLFFSRLESELREKVAELEAILGRPIPIEMEQRLP